MIFKTPEQIEMEEKQLKDEGATFHRWKDMVRIKGTGKFNSMPKDKSYDVHRLIGNILIKKGYAEKN